MDAREVQGNVVLKLVEMLSLLLDSKVLPLSLSVFHLSPLSLPTFFLSSSACGKRQALCISCSQSGVRNCDARISESLREKGKIYCQIYSIL